MATVPLTADQIAKQMAANSAAWKTATPQVQAQLHQQNLDLAKQTGQTYNSGTGTYSAPTIPTVAPVQGATAVNPPVQATKTVTMPGPFINNGSVTAGKTVTVPNPTPAAAPTAPQNTTLQGPYLNPNTGQYQQGANVVNGAIQYANNAITTPAGGSPPPVPTPSNNGLYQDPFARSRDEIAQLAKDRIAKILQAGRTAAGGAREGAKNVYDYTNQIEGDSRNLRNASLKESANPFGGNFGYQAAMNNRNDSIQDTAQDKDYNAQVGLINQKLADLEAAAPGDEQAIIDQLEQIERQTGISVAQLQEQQKSNQANYTGQWLNPATGQYQDTIQKTAQDLQNTGQAQQNLLNQYKIDAYPEESKAQAQLVQQQLTSGQLGIDAAKYNLEQLKDPNSPTNQAAKLDLQMKQLDAKNYPETAKLELEKLRKTVADIGKVHTQPQTANEIEMDKVKLETAKKQLEILRNPEGKPAVVDSKLSTEALANYSDQIENSTYSKAQKLAFAASVKDELTPSDYAKLIAGISD